MTELDAALVRRKLAVIRRNLVDANLHLLRAAGAATPPDYYQSFIELARRGIVPEDLANRLAPSAGLRNRLVHEYEEIDDAIVHQAVGDARRAFADYIVALEDYLSRQGH